LALNDCHSAFACGAGSPGTDVLGHFLPSLRDCSWLLSLPRTSSWATPSRPYGTGSRSALSADLFSANAVHTCRSRKSNLDKIDSQPSLRDSVQRSHADSKSLASLARPRLFRSTQPAGDCERGKTVSSSCGGSPVPLENRPIGIESRRRKGWHTSSKLRKRSCCSEIAGPTAKAALIQQLLRTG
jgi:hypothetical protein